LVFSAHVVTLFPEMFTPLLSLSIVGRANELGVARIVVHSLLDALGPKERADDRPYGGGPGMVLRIEPIARTLDAILAAAPASEQRAVVVTSAAGRPFRQQDADRFARLDRLVLVCGRYEGIDERVIALYEAEEISLGDFVLTGGEIPAMAIVDATVRLLSGAIQPASLLHESFEGGVLDAPAYTRPPSCRKSCCPAITHASRSGAASKLASVPLAAAPTWRKTRNRGSGAR
jgi:tRNA (guanine37-N1)-methyltransferase